MLIHNFHHSHIWLRFGAFWERIFISPAQHQIHHSLNPIHHNKNYGEVLAIWDWIFGTLYVPKSQEVISVGIADDLGNKTPQKHTNMMQALFVPLVDMWAVLTSKR
jgi:sterol desaturase/sphingolipid hydroxylase (fatty acid hydroxylase superfamily)